MSVFELSVLKRTTRFYSSLWNYSTYVHCEPLNITQCITATSATCIFPTYTYYENYAGIYNIYNTIFLFYFFNLEFKCLQLSPI